VRLLMILPRVEPAAIPVPDECPQCHSPHLTRSQKVDKPLRDTHYEEVTAHRYECLACGASFRVYPPGVDHHHTSQRTRGLGIMLYLLGLSYGATSLVLGALDCFLGKTTVYETVQAAAEKVPGLTAKRTDLLEGVRTEAMGADVTSVKVMGEWVELGMTVDDVSGLVLTLDTLEGEDAETLKAWIAPVAEAVGAELLVTDDADAFKGVADELDLEHQVCISHVSRNTQALAEELLEALAEDADGSLAESGLTPEQAVGDLRRLGECILTRDPEMVEELEDIHLRYTQAAPPAPGERATLAYRMRMLTLDRWELWPRLTRYRQWEGAKGERIGGTNNACERAIGWWIKERYRTMRGYKRKQSALNVSRLIIFCGNRLHLGGVDLGELFA
jgi:hypothetical protein